MIGEMHIFSLLQGGLVRSPEMALQLAEVYVAGLYSREALEQQLPLSVQDREDRWEVHGSYNADRRTEGDGPLKIVLAKANGEVMEFVMPEILAVMGSQLKCNGLKLSRKTSAGVL